MKFNKEIPKKISDCPINEAIVEVRFAPNIDRSAVFGILYNNLRESYPNPPQKLPILELPDHIRANDPGLKYRPYYKLQKDNLSCHIGPDVFSTIATESYPGWEVFSEEIFSNIKYLQNSGVVDYVERIGIRYINFFPSNILDNIELVISITDEIVSSKDTTIVTSIQRDYYTSRVQISGDSQRKTEEGTQNGTLIDIDTVYNRDMRNFFEDAQRIVIRGHSVEKEIFFNLLKDDLIQSLTPTY